MHPCSRLMTCPKYRLWTASDGLFLFTLRSTAPAAANADDARSTRPHDKCHHSQMLYGCFPFLFFCLLYQHTWSFQHALYFSFLPTILFFFPPGRVSFRTLVISCCILLVFWFFFCHARGSVPAVSTITHPSPPLLSTFMRYTFITTFPPVLN